MKQFIVAAIVAMSASFASAEYVTVTVCDRGESGTQCETITYKVRPQSPAQPHKEVCLSGEAGEVPCPTRYGVPRWAAKLNKFFERFGGKPVPQPEYGYGER